MLLQQELGLVVFGVAFAQAGRLPEVLALVYTREDGFAVQGSVQVDCAFGLG